jgi:hypothetical protein
VRIVEEMLYTLQRTLSYSYMTPSYVQVLITNWN